MAYAPVTTREELIYLLSRPSEGGGAIDSDAGGAPISLGRGVRAAISELFEIDIKTVGEFYHKIETGFLHIPERHFFIGPPEAQANARYVDLAGELAAVVDRASACGAIERSGAGHYGSTCSLGRYPVGEIGALRLMDDAGTRTGYQWSTLVVNQRGRAAHVESQRPFARSSGLRCAAAVGRPHE